MKKSLMVLLMGLVLTACNPFKVTDPSDPRFDSDKFSFSDYPVSAGNKEQSIQYLLKLFPIGMPKEEVEKILVGAGNAERIQSKDHANLWFYAEPKRSGLSTGHHTVVYDEHGRLQSYKLRQYDVHPNQITAKDLYKK